MGNIHISVSKEKKMAAAQFSALCSVKHNAERGFLGSEELFFALKDMFYNVRSMFQHFDLSTEIHGCSLCMLKGLILPCTKVLSSP